MLIMFKLQQNCMSGQWTLGGQAGLRIWHQYLSSCRAALLYFADFYIAALLSGLLSYDLIFLDDS